MRDGRINRKDRVILEGLVQKYGQERLLTEMNLPKRWLPYVAAAGLAAGAMTGCGNVEDGSDFDGKSPRSEYVSGIRDTVATKPKEDTRREETKISDDEKLLRLQVEAAKTIIEKNLALNGLPMDSVLFDIDRAVRLCRYYNFDLPLFLAQMQVESHFGTGRRARETNSVCSIGLYDDDTRVHYENQDSCFIPYFKIMNRDYLLNGKKTVNDLLKKNGFVNYLGKRYAQNPNYEHDVKVTRDKMIRNYPIIAMKILPKDYTEQ